MLTNNCWYGKQRITDNDISEMDYDVRYDKPPRHICVKKVEISPTRAGERGRSDGVTGRGGLSKKMVVTENGRRKIAVREAITSQLINKFTTADLRPTKMLFELIKAAQKQAGAATRTVPVVHRRERGGRRTADRATVPPSLFEMATTATNPEQT
jgi:hypothetical protein